MAQPRKFGKAEVEVSIRDRVGAGLKAIEQRLRRFGEGIKTIGAGAATVGASLGAAGVAVLGPLTAAINQFTSAGDALDKMAARTGVSVEALAELGFAAEQGGSNLETVERGLAGMSRFLMQAAMGSTAAAQALGRLGLSFAQLQGLGPEQQFMLLAERLNQVQDASTKAAIAQVIFSESGRNLLPMMNGLADIRAEAQELGLVLSSENTTAAAKLSDALNRIRRTLTGAFLQLGAAVAEPLTTALEVITRVTAAVNHFIAKNHGVVRVVAAVAAGFVTVGSVVATVGIAMLGIVGAAVAIGAAIATVGSVIGSVVAALFSPIGAVIAGLSAIAGYFAYTSQAGQTVASVVGTMGNIVGEAFRGIASAISKGNFAEAMQIATTAARTLLNTVIEGINKIFPGFRELADFAIEMWNTIVGAIQAGLLEDAAQLAFTTLEVAYHTVVLNMRRAWSEAVFYFQSRYADVAEYMIELGGVIYQNVAGFFDKLAIALVDGFDIAFTNVRGMLDVITTEIAKAIISAQEFFGLFTAEEANQIRGQLDAELAQRAQGRQSGLGQRMGARAEGLEQRRVSREQMATEFLSNFSQVIRPTRQAVDDSALRDAQARWAEQNASLQAKLDEARKQGDRPDPRIAGLAPQMNTLGRQKAIGTSSAAAVAAGALGFSSRPIEDTAKNTAYMVRLMRAQQRQAGAMGFRP